MSVLIKNGTIVTAVDEFQRDIFIEGDGGECVGSKRQGRFIPGKPFGSPYDQCPTV